MKIKKLLFLLALLSGLFSSVRVFSQSDREITDMKGRKVQIPSTIHRVYTDRFASLFVFALDPEILTNYTFNISGDALNYISPDYYTNKRYTRNSDEELLKLHPDVIILGDINGNEDPDELQKRVNIPVIVIKFRVNDYKATYHFLANVLDLQEELKPIDSFLDHYVLSLKSKVDRLPVGNNLSVYYAEGMKGLNTEPSGSFHSQILDYLNLKNVAEVKVGGIHGMAPVSMEMVMQWHPSAIVVWSGMPAGMVMGKATAMGNAHSPMKQGNTYMHIMHDPLWKNIPAVKDGKVYQIPALPFGWFDRPPSSNCILGIIWTAHQFYPQLMDYSFNEAVKDYFETFYHKKISDSDVQFLMHHH